MKESDEQFFERIINKMFEIANLDVKYTDVKVGSWRQEIPFYQYYSWTKWQQDKWHNWLTKEFKKRYKVGVTMSRKMANSFIGSYGLIIKEND